MRQWHVDPKLMCNKHLLGEHVEHHMFIGTIKKGISLGKYVSTGLVDTKTLQVRHDVIAKEMTDRGMNHKTPLDCSVLEDFNHVGWYDAKANYTELLRRCPACQAKQI